VNRAEAGMQAENGVELVEQLMGKLYDLFVRW
jgi:hypothetical protein